MYEDMCVHVCQQVGMQFMCACNYERMYVRPDVCLSVCLFIMYVQICRDAYVHMNT